jgi:hypothetical protein
MLVLRVPAALLIAAAGAVHLYLWFDFFHRVHVVGTLFLLNAATAAVIAAALVFTGAAGVVLAAVAYCVATLAFFGISTEWGLFGFHERFWQPWQETAMSIELAALAPLAAIAARGSAGRRARSPVARRAGA